MKFLPNEFIHPEDKAALETVQAIPGFATLVKKFMSLGYESLYYGTNMASSIRLSAKQLPEIYNHLPPICEKLGIHEPELYLQMDPNPNARTFGDSRVFITLTSGLVEDMSPEELDAVIAHECGCILCQHVLYHMIADLIKIGADALGFWGNLANPLKWALLYWDRMSELSSDRCAALVTSPDVLSSTIARLSGGPRSITEMIDYAEWAKQADEYESIRNKNARNKTLQALAVMQLNHPFAAVRVREIRKWCASEQYTNLKRMLDNKEPCCPNCGNVIDPNWNFCHSCGIKLK